MMSKNWMLRWGLAAVGLLAFLFALLSEWNDDAIAYSFFIPRYGEDESFTPIANLADIWNSQVNHYYNSNGRFIVHVFVQLFCGLLHKSIFAICNAVVWVLLLYNLSVFSRKRSFLSIILPVLLLWSLPFTPPFQINYVWTACVIVYWIRLFMDGRSQNWIVLILLGIFSFIAGQLHEGFSIPVGAAIIAYFIAKRCKFSTTQWIMAVCFGIGAFVSILAPGNFNRMAMSTGNEGGSVLNLIEQLPALIWFPLIYLLVRIFSTQDTEYSSSSPRFLNLFLITIIAVSAIFNLYLGYLGRGVIPYDLAFILLTLNHLSSHKVAPWLTTALGMVALILICKCGFDIHRQNVKTRVIMKEYTPSTTGRIYLDDELFLFNLTETCQRRNTYTNLLRSRQDADKPFLVIYPESLRDIDLDKDTNMVIQFGEQSWICVQSATHPAEFIVEKTLLPGVLNKQLSPRTLNFSSSNEIFIDSTANNITMVYHNRRPYMKAAIRQTAPHSVE